MPVGVVRIQLLDADAPAQDQPGRRLHGRVVSWTLGDQQRTGPDIAGVDDPVGPEPVDEQPVVPRGGPPDGEGPGAGSWFVSGERMPAPASLARPGSWRSTTTTRAPRQASS